MIFCSPRFTPSWIHRSTSAASADLDERLQRPDVGKRHTSKGIDSFVMFGEQLCAALQSHAVCRDAYGPGLWPCAEPAATRRQREEGKRDCWPGVPGG